MPRLSILVAVLAGETILLLYNQVLIGSKLSDGTNLWSLDPPVLPSNGGLAVADGQVTIVGVDGSIIAVR